ncbi:MAG: hypothetical protein RIR91_1036 [Verrucomicrobiota bacterium]
MTLTPFILGGIAIFVVGRLFAASGEPTPTPPPLPTTPLRRLRKRALKTPPPAPEPESVPLAPPVATVAPVVTQPLLRFGHRAIRKEFASREALRRAIIAQEVLGPPLSLRPPRG